MLNILIGMLIITLLAITHLVAILSDQSSITKMMWYVSEEHNLSYLSVIISAFTIALFLIVIGLRAL